MERDVDRLVRNDRIAWGASMIACKDADAMVTGNIRHYAASVEKLKNVCDARSGEPIFGMTMITLKGKTILVADTNVQDFPSPEINGETKIDNPIDNPSPVNQPSPSVPSIQPGTEEAEVKPIGSN